MIDLSSSSIELFCISLCIQVYLIVKICKLYDCCDFLCLVCPINKLEEHYSYRLRESFGLFSVGFLPPIILEDHHTQDKPGVFPGQFVIYLFSIFISILIRYICSLD
jgi:hypothetical protein